MTEPIDRKALGAFLAVLPDPTFVLDRAGVVEQVGGDARLLYIPPEEAIGRRLADLVPSEIDELAQDAIASVLASGEPSCIEYQLELPIGTREFEARFSKMDAEHVVCIARDVSAHRALERQHRLMTENALDVIVQTDAERRITFISAAVTEILGYTVDEALGMSSADFYASAAEDERVTAIARVRIAEGSQEQVPLETTLQHKEGHEVPIEVLGRAVFDAQGTFIGTQVTLRDITERKRAERQQRELEARFQQAQKLESLGVLAGGIAHDFNNLLVGVLSNASLLAAEMPPDSPAAAMAEDIETAGVRAAQLVRQMLAYAGKGALVTERVALRQMVEETVKLLEATISKKAELNFELAADMPSIQADATQLRQVLMNLVTNASDALEDRAGAITIRCGVELCDRAALAESYLDDGLPEGRYAYLEVADTGCGMEPLVLDKIFDPFFSTKFVGRGLGLAATLGIVRGHRGAITVRSVRERGTVFRVVLPVAVEEVSAAAVEEPSGDWRGAGTVLLVDDEATVRRAGQRVLTRLGFEVLTAVDGRKAVEIFSRARGDICCVLLDLSMPVCDGETCYRDLRRLDASVPVIMSSGYDRAELMQRFEGQGLAGFMQKPYRLAELARSLRRALEGC